MEQARLRIRQEGQAREESRFDIWIGQRGRQNGCYQEAKGLDMTLEPGARTGQNNKQHSTAQHSTAPATA